MTEPELVWEEPPAPVTKYDRIVEALKANPNKWARVREGGSGGCYSGAKGLRKNARGAGIETKVIKADEEGLYRLYARYVPKGSGN